MDLERCSVSSSSSSLPSSVGEIAEDRLVDLELEAAEALADLAHLAMRENGGASDTAKNWGCKGKRVGKRGKTESPPGQSGSDLNTVDPLPLSSDPVDEQTVVDQQQERTTCGDVITKRVKAEEDAESLKSSSICTTRYLSMGGGRSRQNLTEAEKEERRIRRILANRESARQTIRRRQALCEELTRKASDLVQENESLKKEKELAFKEYQSLETINKLLKAQVAKTMKSEVCETQGEVNLTHGEISSTSTNYPLLFYNHHPFAPLGWPPIIQSSLPVQSRQGLQKAVTFSSNISSPIRSKLPSSQEQENPTDVNATRSPLYLVPCPWFLPLRDNENGLCGQPSDSLKNMQGEICLHNGHGRSSSSKTVVDVENHNFFLPVKVKNEASGLTEIRTTNDLSDIQVESSSDGGGGQHNGHHPREATLSPAPLCSIGSPAVINHENLLHFDYAYNNTEDVSTKAGYSVSTLSEKKLPVSYPNKKLVDAGAAAKARKRRKELTKLKNLRGRQCRMHC